MPEPGDLREVAHRELGEFNLKKVLDAVDYPALRAEQAAKRADPNSPTLMGIGLFCGRGNRRHARVPGGLALSVTLRLSS